MKRNRVGKTSVEVSEIAFGCASIGNLFRETSDIESQKVLNRAWMEGINYFDTAPFYGRGLSEMRLGSFLKDKNRDQYVISTKVGRLLTPGSPTSEADGFINPLPNNIHFDYSGDGIEESIEQSCQRLGVRSLDIIYVHDLGKYTHGNDAPQHTTAFLKDGYERLVKLKECGRIGAFGLGVNETQICLDVMDYGPIDVILLAGRLTLLDRSAEEQLTERCRASGTSLVLGGIFNSGILATGAINGATYDYGEAPKEILDKVAKLELNADRLGMPLATAALHFAIQHPACISVLLGTAKSSTLVRNLNALKAEVPNNIATLFS